MSAFYFEVVLAALWTLHRMKLFSFNFVHISEGVILDVGALVRSRADAGEAMFSFRQTVSWRETGRQGRRGMLGYKRGSNIVVKL